MSGTDALPYLGDRYALLSRIGAGGMGCVYLAQDTKHERRVAVKVLDPVYGRAVGTQRFVREIRIAGDAPPIPKIVRSTIRVSSRASSST